MNIALILNIRIFNYLLASNTIKKLIKSKLTDHILENRALQADI